MHHLINLRTKWSNARKGFNILSSTLVFSFTSVTNQKSSVETIHIRIFMYRSSQNTWNKEFGSKHFSLVINLSVQYSLGNTAAEHAAIVESPCVPPQSIEPVPDSKFTARTHQLHKGYHFYSFFPFWQYRFCSSVWQTPSGFAQWKKLLPNHSSHNLWPYSAIELCGQLQAKQFLSSFSTPAVYFRKSLRLG